MSPRNTAGTFTLATPPVIPGTVASATWANNTLGDIATELSSSLDRTGRGGMSAPLRGTDSTAAAPAYSFTSETASGMYRAGSGDLRLAVGGVDALKLVSGGVNGPLTLATGTTSVQVTVSGGFLLLQGNRVAADITLADVVADSSVTRTAGNLFGVRNNGTAKLLVDYQGLLSLASQAAPIQPASLVTAITPDTNVAAANGLGFWKDVTGWVRMHGKLTNNTGVATANLVTATPLPAGFRPAFNRFITGTVAGGEITLTVATTGAITVSSGTLANGASVNIDGTGFLAEA